MKHSDALAALPGIDLGALRAAAEEGEELERKEKLKRLMNALKKLDPSLAIGDTPAREDAVSAEVESKAVQGALHHDRLMQSLRSVVYDSDLKVPGKTNALKKEVDEALKALLKGGAFDDNELAQILGEMFALEGRAATGKAIAGKFVQKEVLSPEVGDCPNAKAMANVSGLAVGTDNSCDDDAAANIAAKLREKGKQEEKEQAGEQQAL